MPATTGHESTPVDDDRVRLAERLRVVLLALLAACAIMVAAGWWTSNGQALWTALAGVVVGVGAWRLNARARTETAIALLLVGMLIAVTTTMIVGEGVHDSGMILYPTVIVLGSLLLAPAAYSAVVVLVLTSVCIVWWLDWKAIIAPELHHLTDVADLLAITTVLSVQAIAAGVLARGLFRSLREARRENLERRAAEEEVRRLNAELEKRVAVRTAELAEANADLESFSYSVSHDLRTPLRVASNYATMLDQEFASEWDPSARQLLERIVASNARMNVLIDELLRFSRLGRQVIEKTTVDMSKIARSVVELLAAGAPDRQVEWIVHPMPAAAADPALIEQVYANLIGNAFKYTGKRDTAHIEIGYDHDGGRPSYFVRDDGVGFDMSHAQKLFGVFERLHREDEFEGNGIGLATAQRILAKHGGKIWALSEPGSGATFRFEVGSDLGSDPERGPTPS